MEVTNRLLSQIPEVWSQRGVAYVLFCRGNKPEEVKSGIRRWEAEEGKGWRWGAETVGTSGKTAGREKLEIGRKGGKGKSSGRILANIVGPRRPSTVLSHNYTTIVQHLE